MKKNERVRQNLRVSRHGANKNRVPAVRRRASKVLGKLLPALPGVPEMLEEIRKEFDIPEISLGEDIEEQLSPGQVIDWGVVRREVEKRLRKIPDVLPGGMAVYQKMIDFKKTLPRKPKFTEPITPKLEVDVRKVYKAFVQLYDFMTDNLAMPWQKAANNFFEAAADNLCGFLKSGVAEEVPNDWINAVQPIRIFGEKMVIVMAGGLANPEEVIAQFRDEFDTTFGKRRPKITPNDVEIADYLRMRLQGIEFKDIVDECIQRHRLEFPNDEKSPEYAAARRTLEDTLKHSLKNIQRRLDTMIRD